MLVLNQKLTDIQKKSNRMSHQPTVNYCEFCISNSNYSLPVLIPGHFGFIGALMSLLLAYLQIFRFHFSFPFNTNFTIIFRCHLMYDHSIRIFSVHSIFVLALSLGTLKQKINDQREYLRLKEAQHLY